MIDPHTASADVFVVGPATVDIERVPGRPDLEHVGGAVLYVAAASARLGARTVLLTRAPPRWAVRGLQAAADAGAEIIVRPGPEVTRFELDHGRELGDRSLRVARLGAPFRAEDFRTVQARAIVLGPLTPGDFDAAAIAEARSRAETLAVGVQGFVRHVGADGAVRLHRPADLSWLSIADVIACDLAEAEALTAETSPAAAAHALAQLAGDRGEVIVTAGDRGAWIRVNGETLHQRALTPRTVVSSTGAGDTFLAGWVVARLEGRAPPEAARLAAAAASLSLEHAGPLRVDLPHVLARARA